MFIGVVDKNKKVKILGDTKKGCPIPRKGEHLDLGYEPIPTIKQIIYDYEKNLIALKV
jgi:hypothetical protein